MTDKQTHNPTAEQCTHRKRWVAWISTASLIAIALLVICCASQARGQDAQDLPTDAEIEQMQRDYRDACEARRKAAQDASDTAAQRYWRSQRLIAESAVSLRETWKVLGRADDPPAPLPEPEPDPGDLPERTPLRSIKNQGAADFVIERPERAIEFDDNGVPTKWIATAGAWLDVFPRAAQLPFTLRNGVISQYGPYPGKPGWDHAIYANNAHLILHDVWLYGPTHLESRGRSHPIYLNGSSLTASRLLIGNPGDTFPHTISINIAGGDGVSNGPQPVDIDTLVVIGGRRVVIEADDGTLSRLHVGRLVVIDPVTADGLWEGIEVQGCPDIEIGEYVVIDTAGRWTSGALIKAQDSAGSIGRAAIYAPNAPPANLIRGVAGEVVRLDAPPTGDMPEVRVETIDELADWASGVTP